MHNVESVFCALGLDMMHLQPMVFTLIFLAANRLDNGVTVLAVMTTVINVNSVVKVKSFICKRSKRIKKIKREEEKKMVLFICILIYIYT